jgi:hypothetical protein
MKASKLLQKRYVQVSDLDENGNVVTIADVKLEKITSKDGTAREKGVLYFANDLKPLPLNNTNVQTLSSLLGEETETWIGQQVKLVVREVEAFGKTAPGIRIEEAPKKKSKK